MNEKTLQDISRAYNGHYPEWKEFLANLSERIVNLLEPTGIRHSVKGRVKSLESLSEKMSFLGRQREENLIIKDLVGLRVVVPFQEGVEQVVDVLRRHFPVEDIERKSDKLSYREFAYDSVHVEIPISHGLGFPACCKPVVEVQVRTILQDAWAEVEHELIYKNHFRYPNNESIRKKLAALNASLTLSDMIFQEIRDSQKEMERWGHERFQTLIDNAVTIEGPVLPQTLTLVKPKPEQQPDEGAMGNRAEIEKYLMAALKAHNEHDYHEAIRCYTLVLERNPELPIRSMVFSHRGMANFMLQRESQALSDFDRSFYCDKSNFRSLNYRALVLRRMGYVEQALECLAMSLDIKPDQADVYFLRAQTLIEIDETLKALNDLSRALQLDPGHAEASRLFERLSSKLPQTQQEPQFSKEERMSVKTVELASQEESKRAAAR
jgi:putative GTP pyrophosphokinase